MEKKEKIILLVEDSEDIRNLFLLYLEEAGYTVVTACHGKEALDKARVQKPNIVVSDILMPIMDGFSLCRHWKKDPEFQKIPFIFYTATYTDSKDRELALNLGADHFILKPSNPALMVEKINYVLEMYEAGKLKVGRPKMEYPDLVEQYNSALVRKLEDKMAEVEQSYLFCKSILNQMQEALFVLDQEGRLEWANQRFMKVFLSQESTILLGQKLEFLVPNLVQIKPFQKVLQDFFRGKQGEEVSQNFEISLDLPKKGFFKVKTFSLKPPRRNDPLLAVIIEDVTEKKLLEKQFFQAQKMESLGRMAGAMVHDINNLLTAIIGNLEILRSILPEENEGQEEIEAIERTCQKASSLSRKLLLLSKKRDEEHPKPMDLNLTIRNLAPILQSISGKSVDFKLHLQPNLPWIYGIPEHIEQILLNLFQNAKEAMPQGGTIEIRTKKAQIPTFLTHLNKENKYREYVVLSVEDGGIGIPAEEMDKIFDPFFSTKKNNTGLGLSST
ncbi:MAG: hybrid sensor histidine kinase/response regulator, partial [Planctomycetota bacterium]